MGVFHFSEIVQMVPNLAKHFILALLLHEVTLNQVNSID